MREEAAQVSAKTTPCKVAPRNIRENDQPESWGRMMSNDSGDTTVYHTGGSPQREAPAVSGRVWESVWKDKNICE